MILKTAANYNDEGGYIEAWKNSDGTTEVKLIPKSGGDEGKQGLKSIAISPAITTTPALDSISINYDDLTEDEKQNGVTVNLTSSDVGEGTSTLTYTPTSDWYAFDSDMNFSEKGEGMTFTATYDSEEHQVLFENFGGVASSNNPDDSTEAILLTVVIKHDGQ